MPGACAHGTVENMNTPTQTEIKALLDQWAAAELAGDADAVAAVLTDDFVGVGPVGFVLNREQWAARHRSGDVDNREFQISDLAVRLYDATAVIVAALTQETTARGHDTSASFRLGIIARNDGTWRIAHIQFSGPLIAPQRLPDFARQP